MQTRSPLATSLRTLRAAATGSNLAASASRPRRDLSLAAPLTRRPESTRRDAVAPLLARPHFPRPTPAPSSRPLSSSSPARAPDRPKLEAKTLLIVYHSYTDGTRQMAQAAWEAATTVANEADVRFSVDPNDFGDAAQLPIQVQLLHAAEAEPEDLLNASSYIFATPENLASMSGVMKDFFDRCYYPCLEKLNGRAYAVLICAGSDGANALRQLDRIATGWRLRKAMDGTIVCTHAQTPEKILATKTIPEDDLKRCREVGEGMAEGLAMGVF